MDIVDPFFFAESTIYLDMMKLFIVPQVENENFTFQQDGALPRFDKIVQTKSLIADGLVEAAAWPPHSPDSTLMVFYLLEQVKQQVYKNIMNEP